MQVAELNQFPRHVGVHTYVLFGKIRSMYYGLNYDFGIQLALSWSRG